MVRQWFANTARGLPRAFWYLWTGVLVNKVGAFVMVFLTIYLTQVRHLPVAFAGLVFSLFGAGGAVGSIAGGVLADRWGRRPTMLAGQVGQALTVIALGFVSHQVAIAAIAFAVGLFSSSVRPAFSAMLVDIVPAKDRLRAFSLNYWAINLGFAVAALLGGALASVDYRLLFLIDGGSTLLVAGFLAVVMPETRPVTAAKVRGPQPSMLQIVTDRVFATVMVASFLITMVFMQHAAMLPITMAEDGISSATYGAVAAVNGALIVAGQLFVPRLTCGYSRTHLLVISSVLTGLGFGLVAVAHSPLAYVGTVVVWTLGEMIGVTTSSTLVADLSPAALRGRYQGVNALAWQIGGVLAPVSGGLATQYGPRWLLWVGCFAVCLVVAGIHILSGPRRERRVAEVRAAEAATAAPELASAAA